MRRAKSHYFLQLANRQRVNTRQYWKILNKASEKKLKKTQIRAIRSSNGTLVTNDKKKAEILNKHFATVGKNLTGSLNNQCTSIELIDGISPTVMEIDVEGSVKKDLSSLNI